MSRAHKILSHMRSVLTRIDPGKFDIAAWWLVKKECGCLVGHAVRDETFAKETGLELTDYLHNRIEGDKHLWPILVGTMMDPRTLGVHFGMTESEGNYLFNAKSYPPELRAGKAGYAEAMRRLDEMITKYHPNPQSAEDVLARPVTEDLYVTINVEKYR